MRVAIAAIVLVALCALVAYTRADPPSGYPDKLELRALIRDFHGRGEEQCSSRPSGTSGTCKYISQGGCEHDDFQRAIASEKGLVNSALGEDRKPVRSSSSSDTITSTSLFNMWYRDQPRNTADNCDINCRADRDLTLNWDDSSNAYKYHSSAWYPVDDECFGNYPRLNSNHNYHFTMELHTTFTYRGRESFAFTGDDDVWVFLDNKLVIDLGGVHGAESACVSLDKDGAKGICGSTNDNIVNGNNEWLELTVGETYNFDFFFAERHTTESNMKITTTIPLDQCLDVDACGTCGGAVIVNPCDANPDCGNGVCSCTGGCQCNDGWVSAGGAECNAFCGDGIVQPGEQCDDPNDDCCDSDCTFIARSAGKTCSDGSGSVCEQPICDGAGGCGVPITQENVPCTGAPATNDPCLRPVCSTTTGTCVNGPKPEGGDCGSDGCFDRVCDAAGLCAETPRADKDCSADPARVCMLDGVCQLSNNGQVGTCTTPMQPVGTDCGDSGNECTVNECDRNGDCMPRNVATAPSGNQCGATPADSCSRNRCLGGTCEFEALNSGQPCTPAPGASLPDLDDECSEPVCQDGSCQLLPANNGGVCTESGVSVTECQERRCSAGKCIAVSRSGSCNGVGSSDCHTGQCADGDCVAVARSGSSGGSCTSGTNGPQTDDEPCQDLTCVGTECVFGNVNENQPPAGGDAACASEATTTKDDGCYQWLCRSGSCIDVVDNVDGPCTNVGGDADCAPEQCNPSGSCVQVLTADGTTCGDGGTPCDPRVCDGAGSCTTDTVNCSDSQAPSACLENGVCNVVTGKCDWDIKASCLCGDGNVTAGEQCDVALVDECCSDTCQFEPASTPCGVNTECITSVCDTTSTDCLQSFNAINSPCTSLTPDDCNDVGCDGAGSCRLFPKDGSDCTGTGDNTATTCIGTYTCRGGDANTRATCQPDFEPTSTSCDADLPARDCQTRFCDGAGECQYVSDADDTPCASLSETNCSLPLCASGTCTLQPKTNGIPCGLRAPGAVPQCLEQQCVDGSCVLVPDDTQDQSCVLDVTTDGCSAPVCNVATGLCELVPLADGPQPNCSVTTDPQCQKSECRAGACVAVLSWDDGVDATPSCDSIQGTSCSQPLCSATTGSCELVPLADGTNAACSAEHDPSDVCSESVCAAGSCVVVPLAAGAACDDVNLCTDDVCDGAGVCVRTPNKDCSVPPSPCQSAGVCDEITGNCTYPNLPFGRTCTPSVEDNECRYYTCTAPEGSDSTQGAPGECMMSCITTTVCGNGVVEEGEECDWAARGTTALCCSANCTFVEPFSPCNQTVNVTALKELYNLKGSDKKIQRQVADCARPICTEEHVCNTVWLNASGCNLGGSSANDTYQVAVGVTVGLLAVIALCLALAGAGLWFWRQKTLESAWMNEFKEISQGAIEINESFQGKGDAGTNAAFGMGQDQ